MKRLYSAVFILLLSSSYANCGWLSGGGSPNVDNITGINTSGKTEGKILKYNSSGVLVPADDEIGAAGTGDVTAVGDCTIGPCFDGTSDGGTIMYFYGPSGFWQALQAGDSAANRSWRLPIAAAPGAGTTRLMNMDEYGQMGFVDPSIFQLDLAVPSQAEAEAGTAATERVWTAERIKQSVVANAPAASLPSGTDGDILQNVDGTWDNVAPTEIIAGTGLTFNPGTSSIDLDNTAVTPAQYTNPTITVDQQGRITTAANGTGGTGAINISSSTPTTPGEANLNDTTHTLSIASSTGVTTFTNASFTAWDTAPSAFSFTDQTDVALSSTITSAAIEVAGINYPAAISVTGGTYDINASGTFVSTSGTVSLGDDIRARHTSSGSNSTAVNTVVTIGGVSDTFTSTTEASGGFSGTLQWLATSATLADYPADLVITPGGGAAVGVNNGEQSGNVNGYDKWFKIAYAAGLIDPLLGRATIKVYPTATGKYVLNLGTANGSFYLSYTGAGKLAFGYRYTELESTNTYALNTWHTVTIWWDSANNDIGMTVNADAEVTNTEVGGVALASTWTTLYLGIINEGATGCGYITDFEVWDNKEGL